MTGDDNTQCFSVERASVHGESAGAGIVALEAMPTLLRGLLVEAFRVEARISSNVDPDLSTDVHIIAGSGSEAATRVREIFKLDPSRRVLAISKCGSSAAVFCGGALKDTLEDITVDEIVRTIIKLVDPGH